MIVVKRNGEYEEFSVNKIIKAVNSAFGSVGRIMPQYLEKMIYAIFSQLEGDMIGIEEIQDKVEDILINDRFFDVAKSYILYRGKHKEIRFIKERADYINTYIEDNDNAATGSEIDANANIQNKNVATLEAELYKIHNVLLSRYRVNKKLRQLWGENAPDYNQDLESHIIYKHDEGSAAAIKPYCVAVNMYPFLNKGTSTLDKLHTVAPKNLTSFTGQFNNLVFLLSSQFQGAVAFGEFFNVFNYYCVKEWGKNYYTIDNEIVYKTFKEEKNISQMIDQAFQSIVYTINQPAGNRSFQSPFTNISYYDHNYWEALFKDFVYPDGTKPEWEAINYLQKKFISWFNEERSKCLLTFPVETVALLSDGNDIIDKEYKNLVAWMYAKGHSFFTYISDNADALSSCCRLKNKIDTNEFSFTNGLTGVATGSKSVITLNLNRITQDFFKSSVHPDDWCAEEFNGLWNDEGVKVYFKGYITDILSRVYKYHVAYNELLWDLYDRGMLPVYSEGYIHLNQQFMTIGINGLNEAAEFLGIKVDDNPGYLSFCNLITDTISSENRKAEELYSSKGHILKFNTEFVPAENLAIKNYNWDKKDGYKVPEDRNCYNSYFFKPDDDSISVLEKFNLHGKNYVDTLDGGVACHINLEEHLSKKQYLKLIEYAVKKGTNYFTFNIPNSQCGGCGYISKHPIKECPKCHSSNISWWTRIIGYLRPINVFSKGRRIEANKRVYHKINHTDEEVPVQSNNCKPDGGFQTCCK